jgi:hypothetical protein
MLNHHIQKSIVYKLTLTSPLRFKDLKPDELDNKLFNYHLKIVVNHGLVTKNDDGLYVLTSKGKTLGVHVYSEVTDSFKRARPELLLAVRNNDSWLMYKRNNEPLKEFVGFMHCEPEVGIDINNKAADYLWQTCKLKAIFKIAGSGIASTFIDGEVESYINYTVLLARESTGSVVSSDPYASYFWLSDAELKNQKLIPAMHSILKGIASNKLFFIDETYSL